MNITIFSYVFAPEKFLINALASELAKKHTIEVVIDRFKVRDDLPLRLAESFETCLALSDGIAKVINMDAPDEIHIFSSKFANTIDPGTPSAS